MKKSCRLLSAMAIAVSLGFATSAIASPCERAEGWDKQGRVFICEGHSHVYKCGIMKKTFCSGKTVYFAGMTKIKSHGDPVNDRAMRVLKFDHKVGKAACAEVYNRPL
jgi:hypothetical protein